MRVVDKRRARVRGSYEEWFVVTRDWRRCSCYEEWFLVMREWGGSCGCSEMLRL